MINRLIISITLLFVSGCASHPEALDSFDNSADIYKPRFDISYYTNATYSDFIQYPPAQQRIDMNNINYKLLHAVIFHETNRQRELHGVPLLIHSPSLEKAAFGHSRDMVKLNFYSHSSKVVGKESVRKRLAAVGIGRAHIGENIAHTFGIEYEAYRSVYPPNKNHNFFSYARNGVDPVENHTYLDLAKKVVNNWMNLPGHRKNILNVNFKYLGLGGHHYQNSKFYNMDNFKITQLFTNKIGEI